MDTTTMRHMTCAHQTAPGTKCIGYIGKENDFGISWQNDTTYKLENECDYDLAFVRKMENFLTHLSMSSAGGAALVLHLCDAC